jgi:hypothetical protein
MDVESYVGCLVSGLNSDMYAYNGSFLLKYYY